MQAKPVSAKKWGSAGLPPGVTIVFPSGPGQYAMETLIRGKYYGTFAYYFSKALLDPVADSDEDGRSLREAVLAAKESLKAAGFDQDPDIVGPGASVALFSLHKIPDDERPLGKVLAVLVRINEYSGSIPNLQGAVNDVSLFRKLLENRSRILASETICHTLTDKEATLSRINRKYNGYVPLPRLPTLPYSSLAAMVQMYQTLIARRRDTYWCPMTQGTTWKTL
jgi:hypothetical protein